MKNRRLYAIVLLVALALLQVRLAFAACDMGSAMEHPPVGGCCGGETDITIGQPSEMSSACEPVRCVEAYAAQHTEAAVFANEQSPSFVPLAAPLPYSAPAANIPLSLAAASPPHTHPSLIYVFGRLLI